MEGPKLDNSDDMEDRKKLLERSWQWGSWTVDFKAKKALHNIQQIWVVLPGLPMIFWQSKIFEAIGTKLGKFIATEENWEEKVDRMCANILVEMNPRDGLFEELKIVMHGSV